MSSVDGVSTQGFNSTVVNNNNRTIDPEAGTLTIDDFYTLLATQMKYQDADNPMDTAEMMNQLVQTQMVEAITQMSAINTTTYGMSMVNQTVTVVELDQYGVPVLIEGEDGEPIQKTTTGVVSGILMGTIPTIFIGDQQYSLSQIMTVGTVPGVGSGEEVVPEETLPEDEVPPVTDGDGDTTTPPTDGTDGTGGVTDGTDGTDNSGGTTNPDGGSTDGDGTTPPTTGGEAGVTPPITGDGGTETDGDGSIIPPTGADGTDSDANDDTKVPIFPDETDTTDETGETKAPIFPEGNGTTDSTSDDARQLIFPNGNEDDSTDSDSNSENA